MTHEGVIIELSRIDSALTKAELLSHLRLEHSEVPLDGRPDRLSKDLILSLHRLIHLGLGK